MDDLKKRLTSRKLWLTVMAVLIAMSAGLAGQMTWPDVVDAIIKAVIAYVAVEGASDVVSTYKTR